MMTNAQYSKLEIVDNDNEQVLILILFFSGIEKARIV